MTEQIADIINLAVNKAGSIRALESASGLGSGTIGRIIKGERMLTVHTASAIVASGYVNQRNSDKLLRIATELAKTSSVGKTVEIAEETRTADELRRIKAASKRLTKSEVRDVKRGRFFLTTAVQGAEVRRSAMAAVETWLAMWQASVVVLPSKAHLAPLSDQEYPLDDYLLERWWKYVCASFQFNKHLTALDMDIRPYIRDPIAPIADMGAEDGHSYIIAHPTQRLLPFPNPRGLMPRVMQATGCITEPLYRNTTSGKMAARRHVMGGLIVEISNDRFHVFEVQFADDGSFHALTGREPRVYRADGTSEIVRAELVAEGDGHGGIGVWGDVDFRAAADEVIQVVQPKRITKEDLWDNAWGGHHQDKNLTQRLNRPAGAKTLADEAVSTHHDLAWAKLVAPEDCVVYVKGDANHNCHLKQRIDTGAWVTESAENIRTIIPLLAPYLLEGKDPVQLLVDPDGKLATWIYGENSLVVDGIDNSSHLDRGSNGSKGSTKGAVRVFGKATGGHTHVPEIFEGVYRPGTTAKLKQGYNEGSPSSWMGSVVVQWPNAQRTQVVFVGGKWIL